jgi:hypothetical protein
MAVFIGELAGLMAHHRPNIGQNRGLFILRKFDSFQLPFSRNG